MIASDPSFALVPTYFIMDTLAVEGETLCL